MTRLPQAEAQALIMSLRTLGQDLPSYQRLARKVSDGQELTSRETAQLDGLLDAYNAAPEDFVADVESISREANLQQELKEVTAVQDAADAELPRLRAEQKQLEERLQKVRAEIHAARYHGMKTSYLREEICKLHNAHPRIFPVVNRIGS